MAAKVKPVTFNNTPGVGSYHITIPLGTDNNNNHINNNNNNKNKNI